MTAPANSACRIASNTAHNTRGADGIHAKFAITTQNRDVSRGYYKCRVESVECKVKGCPDFTTPSIPHNQFTVHNEACAASSVAASFAVVWGAAADRRERIKLDATACFQAVRHSDGDLPMLRMKRLEK